MAPATAAGGMGEAGGDRSRAAALTPARKPSQSWPRPWRAARRCVDRLSRVADVWTRGWRWLPMAGAVGVLPFLGCYAAGVPGHQWVSALALAWVCLGCARRDAWLSGIAAIAVAFLSHSALVITLAAWDGPRVEPLLPRAEDYWQKQLVWIESGEDPEYELSAWVPAHLRLLGGTLLYSFTSLGALTFHEGFLQVDLMNYYNAQLMLRSRSGAWSLAVGWHLWSLLRGFGYLFLSFEAISLALQWLGGARLSTAAARAWRWGLGLSFVLGDGLVKYFALAPVRELLFTNLL